MTSSEHKRINFDFVVDETVFLKLFYLVDYMYTHLNRFQISIIDIIVKIHCSVAEDQEAMRKMLNKPQTFGLSRSSFLL